MGKSFEVFYEENILKSNIDLRNDNGNFILTWDHCYILASPLRYMTFMTRNLELLRNGFEYLNHVFSIQSFFHHHISCGSFMGRWCMMLNKNKSVSPSRQIPLPLSPKCTSAHYGNIWAFNWAVDLDLCSGHSFQSVDVGLPIRNFIRGQDSPILYKQNTLRSLKK